MCVVRPKNSFHHTLRLRATFLADLKPYEFVPIKLTTNGVLLPLRWQILHFRLIIPVSMAPSSAVTLYLLHKDSRPVLVALENSRLFLIFKSS